MPSKKDLVQPVSVGLRTSERKEIAARAKKHGLSLSKYIRYCMVYAPKEYLDAVDRSMDKIREREQALRDKLTLDRDLNKLRKALKVLEARKQKLEANDGSK